MGALRTFTRFVAGTGALLVVWIPVLLLGVLSWAYLVRIAEFLLSPGMPVVYQYEGKGGYYTVKLDSYAIDPQRWDANAYGLSMYDPKGLRLISADKAHVVMQGKAIKINAVRADILLQRRPDGTFAFEDAVPKPTGKKGPQPLMLECEQAHVRYMDEKGLTVLRDEADLYNLSFAQGVDGMAASTTINMTDEPPMHVMVQMKANGQGWVRGTFSQLDITKKRAFIERWVDMSQFQEAAKAQFGSLVMTGNFEADWKENETPAIRAAGDVVATNARYPGWIGPARVVSTVSYVGDRLAVKGSINEPGRSATFDGSMIVKEKPEVFGTVTAHADSRQRLWPGVEKMVPKELGFQGADYKGWVSLKGEEFKASGDVTARSVQFAEDKLTNISANLLADRDMVNVRIRQGQWMGFGLTGGARIGLKDKKLSGYVQTTRGRLEPIAKRLNTDAFRGIGFAQAVVSGTVEKPVAEVFSRGSGSIKVSNEADDLFVRTYEVRGRVTAEGAEISRIFLESPHGSVSGQGDINWETGALDIQANITGVDLHAFLPDVEGAAYANATVKGTLKNPEARVNAEAFGIKVGEQELPHVIMVGGLKEGVAQVESLVARAGSGQIEGSGQVVLDTKALSGQFKGSRIQVGTYTDGQLAGWVGIEDGLISGTLDNPKVSATVSSDGLVASGAKIDSLVAKLEADKAGVRSTSVVAEIGDGRVEGTTLNYDLDTGSGRLVGQIVNVPLSRLPGRPDLASVTGTASGEFEGVFTSSQPFTLTTDLDLADVAINKTPLGNGYASFSLIGNELAAEGELGSIERYLRLESLAMNLETNTIQASAEVFNFALEDIVKSADPVVSKQPGQIRDMMVDAKGLVSGLVEVSGQQDNPAITVEAFSVNNLQLEGLPFGEVRMAAKRSSEGQWTLDGLTWTGPDEASASIKGSFTEDGELNLSEAYINYFNLEWVQVFSRDAPRIEGTLSVQMPNGIHGTGSNPTVEGASILLQGQALVPEGGSKVDLGLNAFLTDITVRDEKLTAGGQVTIKGLTGELNASVPFSAFKESGEREPLSATFLVSERPIEQIAEQLQTAAVHAENDAVSARLELTGVMKDLHLNGIITGRADRIEVEGFDTALTDADINITYKDGNLSVVGGVTSEEGGDLKIDVKANTPNLLAGEAEFDEVLALSSIAGRIDLNAFRVNQKISFKDAKGEVYEADRDSQGLVNGAILITGALDQPKISSEALVAQNVILALPSELPSGRENAPPPIDPVFDINVQVVEASRVAFALGEVQLAGNASIKGSLSDLNIEAPMEVVGGRLNLPTARVNIENGGTVTVRSGGGASRIDLNIEGTTRVTARRATDQYESYDVRLYVRGDLLDPDGLQFDAVSEPAELTRDEILAVLGQKSLIEGLTLNSLQGGGRDALIRETFYTFALPTLANSFTDSLASSLSLDYVALEYNPFDQAVVRAGKEITDGLMLHFLKQLSEPQVGRQKWEVKLTYRPPLKSDFLSKLRLSVGANQDVPWKIRLDWSRRF